MYTTVERQNALARVRRRRAHLIRFKPHWLNAIRDTAVTIDALESLLTLDMKGATDAKKKDEAEETEDPYTGA